MRVPDPAPRRRGPLLLALLAIIALLVPGATVAAPPTTGTTIQILNVLNWHGNLDPLNVNNVQVGGASVISTYWKADRAANPNGRVHRRPLRSRQIPACLRRARQ